MKKLFKQDFNDHYTYLQTLLHYALALITRFKDLAFLDDSDTNIHDDNSRGEW